MSFSTTLGPNGAQPLDQIAGAYTPLLLLVALLDLVLRWLNGDKLHGLKLMCAVVVVYGWMLADTRFQLWHRLALDYSTHTAAALALVIVIALGKRLTVKIPLAVSLVVYGCLMRTLGYHTWADMLATAAIIGLCILPVIFLRAKEPLINRSE